MYVLTCCMYQSLASAEVMSTNCMLTLHAAGVLIYPTRVTAAMPGTNVLQKCYTMHHAVTGMDLGLASCRSRPMCYSYCTMVRWCAARCTQEYIHTMHSRCRVQSSKYNYHIIIHIQTHSLLCIQHMQKPLPRGNLQCSLWGVRCAHALWVVLGSERLVLS